MIFSVCQIRKFSETTECLQIEIFVYINKIVKIIHECAKKWDGLPTNNNGDRYVMCWRLPTQEDIKKSLHGSARSSTKFDGEGKENALMSEPIEKVHKDYAPWIKDEYDEFENLQESDFEQYRMETADRALISAVKTVSELQRA